jgi:recombination protein RecA
MVVEDTIVSIKSVGIKTTYDIKMASPFNNYIAGGFVVHNCGKTTLALHIVAESQKKGGTCGYIDAEHAMDPEYAKKIGVKTNELIITQPSSGEQALDILESMILSQKFSVIVVDSVAALTPKAELEGEMGDANVGRAGKMMSQAMRKLTGAIADSKTVVIFINQLRAIIGGFSAFGPTETTSGGRALRYAATIRIDIRRIAQIKKGEEIMGGRIKCKIVKNKVAPPFRTTEFDLLFGEGISKEGELIALGQKYNLVTKAPHSYGDIKLGRGYDAARVYLKENPDIANKIKKDIQKAIDEDKSSESKVEDEAESNTVEE